MPLGMASGDTSARIKILQPSTTTWNVSISERLIRSQTLTEALGSVLGAQGNWPLHRAAHCGAFRPVPTDSVLVLPGCRNDVRRTGWLEPGTFITSQLCRLTSKIRVWAVLASSGASLRGLSTSVFSLCPRITAPLCAWACARPNLLS